MYKFYFEDLAAMVNYSGFFDKSFHGTTILSVRKNKNIVMAGDGQVTMNNTVIKHKARKIRRIHNRNIIVGFAGATADAFNLYEKLEKKLEQYDGNLTRSSVELAKDWRSDKYLRKLEALMIASDIESTFLLSGSGDVIEPDDGVVGIGSGGIAAQAAAKALISKTSLSLLKIVKKAMEISASMCVFTNSFLTIEEINNNG